MPAAMLSSLAVLASMDLLIGYLPLLGEERGWTVATVSLLLTVRAFASMASRAGLGTIIRLTPRAWLILSATGVSGLAVALLPLTSSLVASVVLMAVIGFFWGIGQPLTMTWVVAISPRRDRSAALSLRLAGNRIGQVVVPAALGVVAAHTGVAAVFWASGVLLAGATEGARRSLPGTDV
jgi:MFS family permease